MYVCVCVCFFPTAVFFLSFVSGKKGEHTALHHPVLPSLAQGNPSSVSALCYRNGINKVHCNGERRQVNFHDAHPLGTILRKVVTWQQSNWANVDNISVICTSKRPDNSSR